MQTLSGIEDICSKVRMRQLSSQSFFTCAEVTIPKKSVHAPDAYTPLGAPPPFSSVIRRNSPPFPTKPFHTVTPHPRGPPKTH